MTTCRSARETETNDIQEDKDTRQNNIDKDGNCTPQTEASTAVGVEFKEGTLVSKGGAEETDHVSPRIDNFTTDYAGTNTDNDDVTGYSCAASAKTADVATQTDDVEIFRNDENVVKSSIPDVGDSSFVCDDLTNIEHETVRDPRATENESKPRILALIFSNLSIIVHGWRIYIKQETLFAGLGLAMLYMTVLGFDVITSAYGYSQGLTESILGILMALGAVTGIVGTLVFQRIRSRVGLVRTGLFASLIQVSLLCLCVISIWLPGSPFDLSRESDSVRNASVCNNGTEVATQSITTNITPAMEVIRNSGVGTPLCTEEKVVNSYASVVVFFAGIVCSRAGLWMFDLTVTQIVQESVAENERGVVGGVQNSFNMLLDMLKSIMVMIAPQPETFGIPIVISFSFVTCGGVLYSVYSRKVRGHLLHLPPKCMDVNSNYNISNRKLNSELSIDTYI